jgi:hypothetical protein
VCFKLPYLFVDANRGEDFLKAQTSTTEGSEPARFILAALFDPIEGSPSSSAELGPAAFFSNSLTKGGQLGVRASGMQLEGDRHAT